MPRVLLTDPYIRSLKPTGRRYAVSDEFFPALRIRVAKKTKSFCMLARWPSNPQRSSTRLIGHYPSTSLKEARATAKDWRDLIRRGIDPRQEKKRNEEAAIRQEEAERRKVDSEISVLLDQYVKEGMSRLRRQAETESMLRRAMLPRWKGRTVGELTPGDVLDMVKAMQKRTSNSAALKAFRFTSAFLSWCVVQQHVDRNVCYGIRIGRLLGPTASRDRVLGDAELKAIWNAATEMGGPFGAVVKLLALAPLRLREISETTQKEVDVEKRVLVLSPSRTKTRVARIVPLVQDAVAIFEAQPKFKAGDYIFSFGGKVPISGFSKFKRRLDEMVEKELGHPLPDWRLHDLRRTVRSRLAELGVADPIAERILGHSPGNKVERVYNRHSFQREMRDALQLWEIELRRIVAPSPSSNVVSLPQ